MSSLVRRVCEIYDYIGPARNINVVALFEGDNKSPRVTGDFANPFMGFKMKERRTSSQEGA